MANDLSTIEELLFPPLIYVSANSVSYIVSLPLNPALDGCNSVPHKFSSSPSFIIVTSFIAISTPDLLLTLTPLSLLLIPKLVSYLHNSFS